MYLILSTSNIQVNIYLSSSHVIHFKYLSEYLLHANYICSPLHLILSYFISSHLIPISLHLSAPNLISLNLIPLHLILSYFTIISPQSHISLHIKSHYILFHPNPIPFPPNSTSNLIPPQIFTQIFISRCFTSYHTVCNIT